MSKFAKFTLIKFVLPTDTSSEEFCTAYYFLHGSLEGKFSVVKSCNTILYCVYTKLKLIKLLSSKNELLTIHCFITIDHRLKDANNLLENEDLF